MNVNAPLNVAASGDRYAMSDGSEMPDVLQVTYEYPNFVMTFENRATSGRGLDGRYSYGIQFIGTDGTMMLDRGGFEIFPEFDGRSRNALFTARTPPARMSVQRGDPSHFNHVKNFIECMKTRGRPISDIEIGHRTATVCHLGNIAVRLGRTIKWDPAKEQIVGDSEAASMLTRPYRAPYRPTMVSSRASERHT